MISPERFVVESRWRRDWLAARREGVTATEVAKAATPSGFDELVQSWTVEPFTGNAYTEFGLWAERFILDYAHREYGVLPCGWLIRGVVPWHMGTPDGLSLDHRVIAEAKTGAGVPKSVPRAHRDQCLWNMWVTGAERCLYLFMPRAVSDDGSFYMGLLEPVVFWVERDESRIGELVTVAEKVWEVKRGAVQPE